MRRSLACARLRVCVQPSGVFVVKRIKLALCLLLPVSVLGLFLPTAAPAAVDMFLELEGIQGESQDNAHKGDVDVLAWSWGVSNSSSATKAGKVNVQDLSLTKYVDSASVPLLMRATSGGRIPSAELTVRRAGENPVDSIKLCMTNVGVSSLSSGGSGGEDRLTENVTLNFSSIVMSYQRQSSTGQPVGNPFVGGWDLVRALSLTSSACDQA